MTGIAVETIDHNGTWVVAEPGVSGDFATREDAQEYVDGWLAAGDNEQAADAKW